MMVRNDTRPHASGRYPTTALYSFVGIGAMPQSDGTQRALEVLIFPDAMRGTGEGHYSWDLQPKSTMTNGNVEQVVTGVDGETLMGAPA
jgi:hypothetical protein